MTREIKFRAWDYENKCWITNWWYYLHGDGLNPNDPNVVLSQYTGITDKNGKEIYEGDIMPYENRTFTVVHWRHDYPSWGFYQGRENGSSNWHTGLGTNRPNIWPFAKRAYSPERDDLEVIGNIYENPELLEKETP